MDIHNDTRSWELGTRSAAQVMTLSRIIRITEINAELERQIAPVMLMSKVAAATYPLYRLRS